MRMVKGYEQLTVECPSSRVAHRRVLVVQHVSDRVLQECTLSVPVQPRFVFRPAKYQRLIGIARMDQRAVIAGCVTGRFLK